MMKIAAPLYNHEERHSTIDHVIVHYVAAVYFIVKSTFPTVEWSRETNYGICFAEKVFREIAWHPACNRRRSYQLVAIQCSKDITCFPKASL